MSMSTRIIGFKPPDDIFRKMKVIWDSCKEADIEVPKEVEKYFEGETPDDAGVQVNLDPRNCKCTKEYSEDMASGYEVDITKLPKDIKIIRFVNSW